MRQYPIIFTEFTKSELHRLRDLASISLAPFTHRIVSAELATKTSNKFYEGQRIWQEKEVAVVFNILAEIKSYIGIQIQDLTEDKKKAPETSNGMITRPKDTLQMLIDNYKYQLRCLDEIESAFNNPTEDDEDEYTG